MLSQRSNQHSMRFTKFFNKQNLIVSGVVVCLWVVFQTTGTSSVGLLACTIQDQTSQVKSSISIPLCHLEKNCDCSL